VSYRQIKQSSIKAARSESELENRSYNEAQGRSQARGSESERPQGPVHEMGEWGKHPKDRLEALTSSRNRQRRDNRGKERTWRRSRKPRVKSFQISDSKETKPVLERRPRARERQKHG